MKIYVINLARNVERMTHTRRQLEALGLAFERVEAFDGYAMSEAEVKDAEKARPLETWGSPGLIGCLFSHSNLWKRVAEGPDAFACIMEDDVHISNVFGKFLKHEELLPENFDLVRCDFSPGRLLLSGKRVLVDKETGVSVRKVLSSTWGAAAYIITRACAQKMAAIPEHEQRVADYLLFDFDESPLAKELVIYQLSPAVVTQDKNIIDESARLHFKSDLDETYVPPKPMKTWKALVTGDFAYALRTVRGYRPLKYVL